jgi:hypothetical protein
MASPDHPLLPLSLLIFALQVAITTSTCIADIFDWPGFTSAQRNDIFGLYGPYLILALLMGVDAFVRVKRQIMRSVEMGEAKKRI